MRDIHEVIDAIKEYNPLVDCDLIERAYLFAKEAHGSQVRLTGEPYIIHPLEIALILAQLHMDTTTVVAGLLHDVIEDTKYNFNDIKEAFGLNIARLVEAVTKIAKLEYSSLEDQQSESFRKMLVAMAQDIRVILIKLADRLHNMRTLYAMESEKQREKSQEVLDIYAPISHRLGIFMFKMEFEDLALRYLLPDVYTDLANKVTQKRSEREAVIKSLISSLAAKLEAEGINCDITGRPKHFYSIYKKMATGKDFNEIYDLTAIRVIVDNISDCYAVLGWVHELWKPIPGRFKDYIAMPKPNMYQSLHTTVIGPGGSPFEIQIRTFEMHETAELGIAAHWKYKEGSYSNNDILAERLKWLMELKEIEEEVDDSGEFLESVKDDLYTEEVYVFTPKGKVIELPSNSTPIDFAYRIHTDVGHRCSGAKVNNRLVPLNYRLQTGEIVEIITNQNSKGPSRDWLNIAASAAAKSKIKAFYRRADKEENTFKGKEIFEREAKTQKLDISQIVRDKYESFVKNRYNVSSWEDLFSVIGYGGVKSATIINKIKEHFKTDFPAEEDDRTISVTGAPNNKEQSVHFNGDDGLAYKLANCCSPVPGDKVIGYVTRGRGITVHRSDCVNITAVIELERLINASWSDDIMHKKEKYTAELFIRAMDRKNLLSEISSVISNDGINISGFNLRTKDYTVNISVDIVVDSTDQVESVINKISDVQSVIYAYRV
ncbi:MAG: bifunctional (p)ppGpp synthetase/guanosine-3',5'-bis(diphosphate) 3'-pyrophosphohydrolase [Eubacteriaceae bacterium]|nr:bifunctional (p)ppGpp synthetase/guanosine-3',5'-bis(diphosphate) 3'-pyrophosphohydrolase [Eubacteriaceae bacterium]